MDAIQLEIATLRSALLEVTHHLEKLHSAIDSYECPKCAENSFPNIPSKRIFHCGDKTVILTPAQSIIVAELINRPGKVVTYDRIIYVVWESGVPRSCEHQGEIDNPRLILSVHTRNIRRKLRKAGLACRISTHWGSGLSIDSEKIMVMK